MVVYRAQMLALLLALSLCTLRVKTQPPSPSPRFPLLTSCLANTGTTYNRLSCISCDTNITVDPVNGDNCSQLNENLSGHTCTELEDVIQSLSIKDTFHTPSGCIEVTVLPKAAGEAYTVFDDPNRLIRQNVVFTGGSSQQHARVVFIDQGGGAMGGGGGAMGGGGGGVPYALRFSNSDLVGITGLEVIGNTGRIGVEDVNTVVIENSVFQYFNEGALDLYNCPTVLVSESQLLHNGPFTSGNLLEYRGDSAGLSVAINPTTPGPPLQLYIYNCTFRNNSVGVGSIAIDDAAESSDPLAPIDSNGTNSNMGGGGPNPSRGDKFQAVGGVVMGNLFTSRGGGLAVIVNDEEPADVVVFGCLFQENGALAFGGGMYVGLDGKSQHSVVINQTEFRKNSSPSTGGGLHMSFLREGERDFDNRVILVDSQFLNNEANYGGGVYFLPIDIDPSTVQGDAQIGVFVRFERCLFFGNIAQEVGGAFGGAFRILAFNTKPLDFIDCTFESNKVGEAGVVSIAFYPINFHGDNKFLNNRGASLSVISSRVSVYGSLLFKDNSNSESSVQDHGAMYITSQGQVQLSAGATLSFVNNSGITGAALHVEAPHVPRLFSKLRGNPLCVFLFEQGRLSPNLWHLRNLSVEFTGNQASVAAAVYINNMDLCSWSSSSPPYFNREGVFHWNFINLTDNVNYFHNYSTESQWAVQTPVTSLNIMRREAEAFPGEVFNFPLAGFDELNTVTYVGASISDNSNEDSRFQFSPSSVSLDQVNRTARISYTLPQGLTEGRVMRDVRALNLFKPNRRSVVKDSFTVSTRRCPPGLILMDMSGLSRCVCDVERPEIVTCEGRLITLNTHLWGSIDTRQARDTSANTLLALPCPAGYCQCRLGSNSGQRECTFVLDPDEPDSQCSCNRTGVLCGECPEGTGLSVLLSRCVSCDSLFGLLILALVIVDVAIIILLLILMKPIPLWFYPVLCYLQLLPHFTEYFPITFELVRPYILFVASALGLYFPYDFCLSSENDAVGNYALRYLPPLLALVVSIVVIIIRSRVCRPCSWHGVWWLMLLLYTPLLHTSISILNCPIISAQDNENPLPRWQVNGNMKCFNGTHIPIAILAILVLIYCVALVPICILMSLSQIKRPRWIRFLEEPLTCAYKDSYKWWSGIELGKRIVLVLFAIVLPNNDYAVVLTLMVIIAVGSYCQPYKQLFVNVLDLLLACDILVMLMLRNTPYLEDQYQVFEETEVGTTMGDELCSERFTEITKMVLVLTPFYYVPLAVGVAVLTCWLLYHTYNLCTQSNCAQKANCVRTEEEDTPYERRYSMKEVRARTQTIVDLKDLDPETPNDETERNFEMPTQNSTVKLISAANKKQEQTNGASTVSETNI